MKILLLKDVPRVGSKGQIVDLAQAYAMNSFVNKGLARMATVADEKSIKIREEIKIEKKKEELDKYRKTFLEIAKESINFKEKVDEKNHLYKKINKDNIVDYIYKKYKISINEKQIKTDVNINQIGSYDIVINNNNIDYNVVVKIEK